MSKTRWIVFAVICVAILGGLIALAGRGREDVSDIDASQLIATSGDTIGDHIYGNKAAKVIVYEYGDFQCPSCGGAYPQLKQIKAQYKDQIAFVFRNFPLTTIHPNALSAAAAAEAAGKQGKFWEMHDQLYDNQNSWSSSSIEQRNSVFEQYATAIGLNLEQYRTDLVSKAVTEKISRDRALAKKLALDSTPSLVINDQKVNSEIISDVVSSDGTKLKAEIDTKLKAAGVELPKSQ